MDEMLEFLRCPVTRQRLHATDSGDLVTAGGAHRYPVVHGIPDFRLFEPPYMTRAEESAIADRMIAEGWQRSYDDLVRWLETELLPHDSAAAAAKSIEHRLSLRVRAPRRFGEMAGRIGGVELPPAAWVLDLGCGSGEAASALTAAGASSIVGVDISLIELVLAKKLHEEQGTHVFLVAGCAEALPFRDEQFDFVYSPDVIEHVSDQGEYLGESKRVLRANGQMLLNSPNRFSVVCPEPHVGIWGLTFLPRPLIDPACRLFGKGPYIGKRLVSLRELKKLVAGSFGEFRIVGRPSNPTPTSFPGQLYRRLSPFSENLFSQVCDQHVVLARRHHSI